MASHISKAVVVLSITSLLAHCNKEKKNDPVDTSSTKENTIDNEAGTLAISTNGLAVVYPEGLAVSAFPKGIDPSPGAAAPGTVNISTAELKLNGLKLADCTNLPPPPQPIPPECQNQTPVNQGGSTPGGTTAASQGSYEAFEKHPKEILEENQKRLSGDLECFDNDVISALTFSNKMVEVCYGFDYGIASGNALGTFDQGKLNPIISGLTDQSLNGIKTALLAEPTLVAAQGSEACMVVTGRKLVSAAAARVDGALRLIEGMLCQAKKNGSEDLPAVGASKDMLAAFADFSNVSVSKAEISRLDDKSGRPVYRSTIVLKLNNNPSNSGDFNFELTHSPGIEGNGTYEGVLATETEVEDDQTNSTYAEVSSVTYAKSGSTVADQKLKIEIRDTSFNKTKIPGPYINSEGRIDLNLGADASGNFGPGEQNQYMKGVRYFAFDINPSSYAGNIAFWNNPGGSYNEQARGFVYETTQNSDGTLSGCSFAGADAGSIRAATAKNTILTPTGCYTPQISNGVCGLPNNNVGKQVFKQCFKQNTEGLYQVDTVKTTGTDGIDILVYGTDTISAPKVDVSSPKAE